MPDDKRSRMSLGQGIQTTRQRRGVRWQRCTAQVCIDDTAFAGYNVLFSFSLPSGLQKQRRAQACRTHYDFRNGYPMIQS